jgi:hypothetical protein
MPSPDLFLGDLKIVDDEKLGFSVYLVAKPERSICWINKKGEKALAIWLNEKKYPEVGSTLGGIERPKYHK